MFKSPSSAETKSFYDGLISQDVNRSVWGVNNRFNPQKIAASLSTQLHYEETVKPYCSPAAEALDVGCSTGGFTGLLAKYCGSVIGVDLSEKAVALANAHFVESGLDNCTARSGDGCRLDFADESFDIIQMVDVVHHAEDASLLMAEIHRLLKPTGKLIVFEPNKYNLALWLMCAFDRNEWGALRLGSKSQYRRLFSDAFHLEEIEYNGLLIGPDGRGATRIANWLAERQRLPWLQAQSPKIFMLLSKK